MARTRVKRGELYRVGDTGFTLQLTYKGYVIRCGDREVAVRMSRKSALAWVKRNRDRCRR